MRRAPYSYRDDPNVPMFKDDKPIIVFDGHCVLCSRWANIVLRYDTHKRLRLLAAQSPLGEALYGHYGLKSNDYDTNLLIQNGCVRVKSDGSIAMCETIGGLWRSASILRLIPRPLRDWVYGAIAKRRIRWFGAREVCYMLPKDALDRFL